MALKPWYRLVTPREDLREGKPLDASEFAVHLDQVRDGRAPQDYQEPEKFFERTYLTKNLTTLAAEVVRRLSGEKTETNAVFNMVTPFGGGKTHALTLLYHLAKHGPDSMKWQGVDGILRKAGVSTIPQAATAVFVGTEFDSITGRGGDDGTPNRKTPWGEIAFQLGGEKTLALVAEHEKRMTAPAGDVIRRMLPNDKPCLILIDELMNYISRNRKSGLATQLYDFLHNLSEVARGEDGVALAVSIPASELEMSSDDIADCERFKKLLDRLGKAVIMSAEAETSEIIRRRLFEWFGVPDDANKVASEYADWILEHRQQIPGSFPIDHAREAFLATYPFHPMALSVFERKWQTLPRFQQTRGVLRLLALWVSKAYQDGYKGGHHDPLIGLGTAPLDDPMFRSALFEQLGESKLEGAVTTDIAGKKDSHAVRLDKEAVDAIKKARLHRKVATVIFFESNGGQSKNRATVAEIRLATGEPDVDIGNIETVLEALAPPDGACYYLDTTKNSYWFDLKPNLQKVLADRKASIQPPKIEERMRAEIQTVFVKEGNVEVLPFPEKSGQIDDRAVLTLVVLSPDHSMQDKKTLGLVESMTKEHGTSSRTFKSALIWAIAEDDATLREEARKVLAWEEIDDESEDLRLSDSQKKQLGEHLKRAERDLKECVWRTYKNVAYLGKDNTIQTLDMGLINSSQAKTITRLVLERLGQKDEITDGYSPTRLVKQWPPAFAEWSTKAVRDAFYASPQFPRLLDGDAVKDMIAKGVANGIIAYVGKTPDGRYAPFHFNTSVSLDAIEISEDMFIITAEEAKRHIEPPKLTCIAISPENVQVKPGKKQTFQAKGLDQHGREMKLREIEWEATGGTIDKKGVLLAGKDEGSFIVTANSGSVSGSASFTVGEHEPPPPPPPTGGATTLTWTVQVPQQKWMNFYTKVLSKFATGPEMKLTVSVEVSDKDGFSEQKIEETKAALRELGLKDDVEAR